MLLVALAVAAVGLWWWPRPGVPAPRRDRGAVALRPAARRAVLWACGAGAVGVLVALPWWCTACVSVGAGFAGAKSRARAPAPTVDQRRALAGVLDLLAAGVEAGLSLSEAVAASVTGQQDAVARAAINADRGNTPAQPVQPNVDVPGVATLAEIAALLALGAEPVATWRSAARCPDLAPVAAAAELAAVGGAPMAQAARSAAVELRAACRAADLRAAARAGLAMTAPLTLCFLPAFLCWGLAPVVIGLVQSLDIW